MIKNLINQLNYFKVYEKILMLLALAGVSAATMAQQKPVVVEQVDIIQVQDKYQVITNPFWSNWFSLSVAVHR